MIVVDTDVLSELMRPRPSPAVLAWVEAQPGSDLATTAITVAEIRYGLARLPTGRKRTRLIRAADEIFRTFAAAVVPFDSAAAQAYADIVVERERAGAPIAGFDAQIAAICRVRTAVLATRNIADFEGIGLSLVDPWGATAQ